jgi:hypothetical protein
MGADGLGCFDANSLEGLVYRSDPSHQQLPDGAGRYKLM